MFKSLLLSHVVNDQTVIAWQAHTGIFDSKYSHIFFPLQFAIFNEKKNCKHFGILEVF